MVSFSKSSSEDVRVFSLFSLCLIDFKNKNKPLPTLPSCYILMKYLICCIVSLMAYQHSWLILCQIYSNRRPVVVLFDPLLEG